VAVLGVIFWHAELAVDGRLLLPGGFLGVDVFFVISGFLMARIWDNGISTGEFAKRRLRRILPMLFSTILACIPFAIWLMSRSAQADFGEDAVASTLLVPNIIYGFQDSYWAAPGKLRPLLHLWTIGIEMQFYLICPLIFLVLRKWKNPILGLSLIVALSLVSAIWLSRTHQDLAFYGLPTRLWEFGLGALFFYTPRFKIITGAVSGILGLLLVFGSFIFLSESIMHPAWLTLLTVLGTCFVISAGSYTTGNILLTPALRRVGLISFSAYLIHQPLFAFTRISTEQVNLPITTSLILIAVTLGLSELTYRFVETPLRKPGKSRGVFISLLGAVTLLVGFTMQFNSQESSNNDALLVEPDRWLLYTAGYRCAGKDIDDPCRTGNSNIRPSVALVGDSHIQAMAGGFDELFIANKINDVDYSMGGCPFIIGVQRYARKFPCDEFVEDVFERIAALQIETVVILDRRNAYLLGDGAIYNDGTKEVADLRLFPVGLGRDADPEQMQAEIERLHLETIKRLRKRGVRVIIIYPVPEIAIHVPDNLVDRVKSETLPLALNRKLHDARQAPLASLKALAANDPGILEINPDDIFCDDNICLTHSDDEIYYTDSDHLSRAGTKLLLSGAGESILDFLIDE